MLATLPARLRWKSVSVYSGTSTNKHRIIHHMFKLWNENKPHNNNSIYFVPRTSEITIRFSSQALRAKHVNNSAKDSKNYYFSWVRILF